MDRETTPHGYSISKQSNSQENKLGYVYRHIRLDTNMPFYIGIGIMDNGKYKRAYSKNRSKEWGDITLYGEYRVEILLKNVSLTSLGNKEKYFIQMYGRIDLGTGTLVNKTNGGKGTCGKITSEKTKQLLRQINLGKKMSPEAIEKTRQYNLGKKQTDEQRRKISEAKRGNKNWLGKKHTQETKDKTSKKVG